MEGVDPDWVHAGAWPRICHLTGTAQFLAEPAAAAGRGLESAVAGRPAFFVLTVPPDPAHVQPGGGGGGDPPGAANSHSPGVEPARLRHDDRRGSQHPYLTPLEPACLIVYGPGLPLHRLFQSRRAAHRDRIFAGDRPGAFVLAAGLVLPTILYRACTFVTLSTPRISPSRAARHHRADPADQRSRPAGLHAQAAARRFAGDDLRRAVHAHADLLRGRHDRAGRARPVSQAGRDPPGRARIAVRHGAGASRACAMCIDARTLKHDTMTELAQQPTVPVINGLTDYNHPTQVVCDVTTMIEHMPAGKKMEESQRDLHRRRHQRALLADADLHADGDALHPRPRRPNTRPPPSGARSARRTAANRAAPAG